MSDPSSYPGGVTSVQRHETHGAIVFLAGEEAIKIKRAVRFHYMDLSTLEKRRVTCFREVEINHRFAPELYLGCVPIRRRPGGGLAFGERGEIVEWAVRMRRFDQQDMLSSIALTAGVSSALAKSLADTVFAAHSAAEPKVSAKGPDRVKSLIEAVTGNLESLEAIPRPGAIRLDALFHEHLAQATPVLEDRAKAGFVRRCHGDLHLGNIVLWEGRPTLFDALEFDDELATIDTLYDLAFLLMDLDHRGQRPAANVVMNRYLWHSGAELDLVGLCALPLFLGLRSAVRAMVSAERASQRDGDARAADEATAHRYLEAALRYLEPARPRLIAVAGLSGTGKSTLASALAPGIGRAPGAVHLRSDLERKRLANVAETERLDEAWYATSITQQVYATLCDKAIRVLAAGHGAVVDAVYARVEERAAIEAVARELGIPFSGLWLSAEAEKLIGRVGARRGDASDATAAVVRQQLQRERGPLGETWVELDAGGSAEETLARARRALGSGSSSES